MIGEPGIEASLLLPYFSFMRLKHKRISAFLQVFRQAGPPQRVDGSARMGNQRNLPFSRTQRRIASSRIEPGVTNLSITDRQFTI